MRIIAYWVIVGLGLGWSPIKTGGSGWVVSAWAQAPGPDEVMSAPLKPTKSKKKRSPAKKKAESDEEQVFPSDSEQSEEPPIADQGVRPKIKKTLLKDTGQPAEEPVEPFKTQKPLSKDIKKDIWQNELRSPSNAEKAGEDSVSEQRDEPISAEARRGFEKAVMQYIKVNTDREDGLFHLSDEEEGTDRALLFRRLHVDKMVHLEGNQYFAHADFLEKGDKQARIPNIALDIDFYAMNTKKGWRIQDVLIHLVEGQPRFTYDKSHNRILGSDVSGEGENSKENKLPKEDVLEK